MKQFYPALKQAFSYLMYTIPFVLFFIDVCSLSLFHYPVFQTLASFCIIQLLYFPSVPLLTITLLLISIISSVMTGNFLPYLAYIIGVLLITKGASLYSSHLLIICITAIITLSSYPIAFFTYSSTTFPYTIIPIIGNLIIVYVSLKWFPTVKRGNRA